jgi:hypothetical protein
MSTQIVKPEVLEVVPRPNLEGVESALDTLRIETDKLEPLRIKAEALKVTTAAGCAEAKALQLEVRSIGKQAGFNLDRYWEVVKKVTDFLSQKYSDHEGKAKAIDDGLKQKVKVYEDAERKAAQAEQDRINAENARIAREKAEEQRKADEKAATEKRKQRVDEIRGMLKRGEIGKRKAEQLLREAGATEEADKAKAAADEEQAKNAPVPQVKVQPNIPTQAGVPSRKTWKFRVLDETQIPRAFMTPNEIKIGATVRFNKDKAKSEAEITGIEAYEE